MRYVENILIASSLFLFILKEMTFPFAGIGFSLFMVLLSLFYLTSKLHIFKCNEFNLGTTLISGIILWASIIFLLMFLNNWIESIQSLVKMLIIQVLWFAYLIFQRNKYRDKLSKRIGSTAIIFSFLVSYIYLASYIGSDMY